MKMEGIYVCNLCLCSRYFSRLELGYVTSELNSGRFFKKGAQRVSLKTVSYSKETIHTMGRMAIVPDCLVDDIIVSKTNY